MDGRLTAFDDVEEELHPALEQSLDPRGPDGLSDPGRDADCLWHVYAMSGTLHRRAYVLRLR